MTGNTPRMVPAAPGNRLGAKLADQAVYILARACCYTLLVSVLDVAPSAKWLTPLVWACGWTFHLAYDTYFVSRFGATPGKMLLCMRVATADGSRPGWRRALCRSLAEWLSKITLGAGYAMALFDPQRRTLHDRLCGTVVVTADKEKQEEQDKIPVPPVDSAGGD